MPRPPSFCSVDGCDSQAHARSLCRSHYFEQVERPRDPRYAGGDSLAVASASPSSLVPAGERLVELEQVIERGLQTFVDVGMALLEIRDTRLYLETHRSFDAYCKERWDFSRDRADQLIVAAQVPTMVGTPPENERQARILAGIAKTDGEDTAREVWGEVQGSGEKLTAALIEETHKRLRGVDDEDLAPGEAEAISDTLSKAPDSDVESAVAENIESKRIPQPLPKRDLGNGVSHPAPYTPGLVEHFALALIGFDKVLDPFAGTGRIHELQRWFHETTGVEIEPEWANLHADTIVGDALSLPFEDGAFDAICTSPTYGNRLADKHNASDPEARRSYTHDLGRSLNDNNSGGLQWGDEYRDFHERAWKEAARVLRPGGRFVLNIKDHIRNGEQQHVSEWHAVCLQSLGMVLLADVEIRTPSLRAGSNADVRIAFEHIYVLERAE